MNNKEINAALAALNEATFLLEEEYTENGGEMTETTEAKEQEIESLKQLLIGDGIDSLGRWLKSKEDQIKARKAERDMVNREISRLEDGIEFIKSQIYNVLVSLGEEKVKGSFYSFATKVSVKTEVDKEILKSKYEQKVADALRAAGIPSHVTCTLGASIKAWEAFVNENPDEAAMGGLPEEFRVQEKPSCRFIKPRANKEV